jgi:hypothetical protein
MPVMNAVKSPVEGGRRTRDFEVEDGQSGVESDNDEVDNENESEDELSSSGSEEEEDNSNPIRQGIDDAIEAIKNKTYKFSSKSGRDAFFEKYGEWIRNRSEDDDQTILHILADTRENIPFKTLELPVKKIIQKNPTLLLEYGKGGKTPLFAAIENRKTKLVELMVESGKLRRRAIGTPCGERKENCLHLAMRSRLPAKTKLELIKHATEEDTVAGDSRGYTPLHHAAEYKRSNAEQFEVVKALIKKNDSAIDKFSKDDRSVYQYHLYTRKIYKPTKLAVSKVSVEKSSDKAPTTPTSGGRKEELPSRTGKPPGRETGREPESRPGDNQPSRRPQELDPKALEAQQRREELERASAESVRRKAMLSHSQRYGNREEPDPKQREPPATRRETIPPGGKEAPSVKDDDGGRGSTFGGENLRNVSGLSRRVTFREPERTEPEEGSKKKAVTRVSVQEISATEKDTMDNWADVICQELKLHCMRTRTPEQVSRFLYGKNTEGKSCVRENITM